MSTTLETLNFFRDLLKGEHSHPFWSRLLAASWGSAVFHGALLGYHSGLQDFDVYREITGIFISTGFFFGFFFVLATIIIYSLTFGLTVAVSISKGSLMRHFVYGVLLPAFAYSMARIAFWQEIAKPAN